MSHGKGDYHWWDLDGTELAGLLYNTLMPIQLGADDYGNDWGEFQRRNPAGAYAWQVGSQHEVLDQAIIALRPVQKFVRVRGYPSRPREETSRVRNGFAQPSICSCSG